LLKKNLKGTDEFPANQLQGNPERSSRPDAKLYLGLARVQRYTIRPKLFAFESQLASLGLPELKKKVRTDGRPLCAHPFGTHPLKLHL
jgi:hypothetical protein